MGRAVILSGIVIPGRGLGVPRMINSAASDRMGQRGGFPVVPGTLNVRLPVPIERGPHWQYLAAAEISPKWEEETGQAGYFLVHILIANRYRGLAFQADELAYPADQVELVSEVHPRSALGLHDGDRITFSMEAPDPMIRP